ncbi:MAG: proliferating cell nuclear antigen (pcna) [Candidatus Altiarchaeales archaeon]|nr:proliferating cell nuclear antigen (pcna) [Candidatus Altiarchaeales archaeon]MBD3416682.1 proliferating cell nuclear antigen (pcna) [Candidatus Altiarchaeales archaeon]
MQLFEAVINDTKSWRNSIEAIAALIDEGTFQVDSSGIKLRAMDPSQIALVDFEIPSKAFEKFKCENPISLGVDFSELSKITKRSKPEDKIELKLAENRLKMVFKGETRRQFTTAIIDSTGNPPKEPKIEFTADVKIAPNMIKDALKDAELISNHVALKLEKGFNIKSDGDTGSADIEFPEDKLLSISVKSPARSVYSLDYLNNILKSAEIPSVVMISLKTDAPLKVEYSIGDGRVIYYLAPRIESV